MTKPRDATRAIENKLPGAIQGTGKERNCWAVLDGRKVLRVTYPKVHRGDLKPGTRNSIRKQLRLEPNEFEQFLDCSMTSTDYESHLRLLIDRGEL